LMTDRVQAVGLMLEGLIDANRVLAGPRMSPFAGLELGRSHLEALFLIAHRDCLTPGGLASAMRITAGAVTQLLAKLREADLVVATPAPADSRSVTLALTDSARAELADVEARAVQRTLPRVEHLSTDELEVLAALLRSVAGRP
jgi:DNA-binding MarR family transcriptional regulator